jgi:hypothetical protein
MNLNGLDRATNQVEIRSEVKVLCSKCQTEGKKSKVILYPGQTIPKMSILMAIGTRMGISLSSMKRLKCHRIFVAMGI